MLIYYLFYIITFSGPEAKAALLIRREVMDHMLKCEDAVKVMQTQGRGLIFRYKWMRIIITRRKMAGTIQRCYRGARDRSIAHQLRLQQWSEWEQLWDERRQLMYYYNITTRESTYEEPKVPFRPLVRHLKSSALMQAWPFLDDDPRYGRTSAPSTAGNIAPHLLCDVCSVRKAVRLCKQCPLNSIAPVYETARTFSYFSSASSLSSQTRRRQYTSFCFSCFTKNHSDDPNMRIHEFQDITSYNNNNLENNNNNNNNSDTNNSVSTLNQTYLTCCECGEPATRKCLGVLDDDMVDELCLKLKRSNASEWMVILKQSNVAGEKKLNMLLSQMQIDNIALGSDFLSSVQLQSVRSVIERIRAECDETYCTKCYKDIHSGGKRANHLWRGFDPYASMCTVCTKSPTDYHCTECDSVYCKSCYKVFHGKGRKRKHTYSLHVEVITEEHQNLCVTCERRIATEACSRCGYLGCDSCYECIHKPACDKNEAINQEGMGYVQVCVLCGEKADKKCTQCGDMYCSKMWMGNPGCFAKFHHTGNRIHHVTEPLPPEPSPLIRLKSRGSSNNLHGKKNMDGRRSPGMLKKSDAFSFDSRRSSLTRKIF